MIIFIARFELLLTCNYMLASTVARAQSFCPTFICSFTIPQGHYVKIKLRIIVVKENSIPFSIFMVKVQRIGSSFETHFWEFSGQSETTSYRLFLRIVNVSLEYY